MTKRVEDAWRDINDEMIINAFVKAKLLGYYKNVPHNFHQEAAQIPTKLEEIDIYNPYLDHIEEEWIDNSELDIEDE